MPFELFKFVETPITRRTYMRFHLSGRLASERWRSRFWLFRALEMSSGRCRIFAWGRSWWGGGSRLLTSLCPSWVPHSRINRPTIQVSKWCGRRRWPFFRFRTSRGNIIEAKRRWICWSWWPALVSARSIRTVVAIVTIVAVVITVVFVWRK